MSNGTVAPSAPLAPSSLTAPYARRRIDLSFSVGTGNFGMGPAGTLTFTGLRVNAHLENVVSPHLATDVVLRIYGMSLSHMNALSVAGLLFEGRLGNTVRVSAGDDITGMTIVANATIHEAYPDFKSDDPDDRYFYVYASGIADDLRLKPVAPTSYTGSVKASDILTTLAGQAGLALQNYGVNAVLQRPYLWGTTYQQIQAVVRAADCFSFIDNVTKTLVIWPKDGGTPPQSTVVISAASGMIGYPQFQQTQITVKTLFNPALASIGPGLTALIQSDLTAANNANIQLSLVTHDLESENPGGLWETTVIGVPSRGGAQP